MFGTHFNYLILGSLVLTVGVCSKKVCQSPRCTRSAEMFLKNMDPNNLPCHNFYDFMCGNFKNLNPLEPGKEKMSAFTLRERYVNQKILEFLNNTEFNNLSSVRKARATYKTCMDEATIEQIGEAVIPMELNAIGLPIRPPFDAAPKKGYNFSRLLAKLHRHSVFTKFLFNVSMAPYENDVTKNYLHFDHTPSIYQFGSDENPKELEVFAFRSHMSDDEKLETKMVVFTTLKETIEKVVRYMNELTNAPVSNKTNQLIEKGIKELIDFFKQLNATKNLENPAVEGRFGKHTKMTVAELQQKTDEILGGDHVQIKINWLDYFETLFEGLRGNARQLLQKGEPIMIKNLQQLEATLKVISEVSRKVFISALWWTVTQSVSPMASTELRKIYYDHYSQLVKKEFLPRQSRCLNVIKLQFPFIFAVVLVFADENALNDRKQAHQMVFHVRDAFEDTITKSTWLDSSTKMAALNKLQYITQIVSFQTWMLNPIAIELFHRDRAVIPGHFYATLKLLKKTARNRNLSLLGRPNIRSIAMPMGSSAHVNAGYSPDFNIIDIPIGILGPPFYSMGLEALNYGAIGVVMAHELGHAFDNMGKEYDSWGKKRKWWKKRMDREFNERAECFVKSYSEIMLPSVKKKVDGKLTLDENIADYIGFTQALKAYRKYVEKNGEEDSLRHFEHYSAEKLFTMAFANIYCETSSLDYDHYRLHCDEHSPGRARVQGVLRNSPDFAKIWRCPDDADMNPKEKCQLW